MVSETLISVFAYGPIVLIGAGLYLLLVLR